jgi:pimeloyl-ACP methyl ester carboxylesterase
MNRRSVTAGRRARIVASRPGRRPGRLRIVAGLAVAGMTAAGVAACGSPAAGGAATTASVISTSAQVAQTAFGPVGYREVGSGQPLVLIMGYGGTMETWEPQFVDTLAMRYRVVIFDNAGIGRTRALPQPLSIDAMANQTSALINALNLGRPDVLGWSEGGMIAQALAVLHPQQVSKLVLCATFPGVGTVIPPQSAINDLTNGNGLSVLFPANQAMAADAFAGATETYPTAEQASAAVISAQGDAALSWWHGGDAAGRRTSTISAPTLVADGTEDQLDAESNSRAIARLIPGAKLVLYTDAGHGFLFQEGTPFAATVQSFLSGPARPLGTAAIRAEFLAGESQVMAAGRTWVARLKGLSPQSASSGIGAVMSASPSAAEVAGIDQPFAAALTDLDYRLLAANASGVVGDAITPFVSANEKLADDILALAALSGPTAKTWTPTIASDSAATQRAETALRTALGLGPQR